MYCYLKSTLWFYRVHSWMKRLSGYQKLLLTSGTFAKGGTILSDVKSVYSHFRKTTALYRRCLLFCYSNAFLVVQDASCLLGNPHTLQQYIEGWRNLLILFL